MLLCGLLGAAGAGAFLNQNLPFGGPAAPNFIGSAGAGNAEAAASPEGSSSNAG